MDIKKGQTVWVWSNRNGIEETKTLSVGRKYIILEHDSRIKYNSETLKQVNGYGLCNYIILDKEEYEKDCYYSSLISKFNRFDFKECDREDLDEIYKILNRNYL